MITINELKKQGIMVMVYHGRTHIKNDTSFTIEIMSRRDAKVTGLIKDYTVSHKGGFTLISLISSDGKSSQGKHNFNKNNSFNRKIGIRAALGKALKEFNLGK